MRWAQQQTTAVITICTNSNNQRHFVDALRLVLGATQDLFVMVQGEDSSHTQDKQQNSMCRAGWHEEAYLNRQQATPDLDVGAACVVLDKIQNSNADRKEDDHVRPQALVEPDQDAAHPANRSLSTKWLPMQSFLLMPGPLGVHSFIQIARQTTREHRT